MQRPSLAEEISGHVEVIAKRVGSSNQESLDSPGCDNKLVTSDGVTATEQQQTICVN